MTTRFGRKFFTWLFLLSVVVIGGCSGKPPVDRGVRNGSLLPCPASDNCVCSMAEDDNYFVSPLIYQGPRDRAMATMKTVISEMENTALREETVDYLYVEFTSKLIRFVDDVEFFFPENESHIHVRSASRLGYSDLGVNRKRVEEIRLLFSQQVTKMSQ